MHSRIEGGCAVSLEKVVGTASRAKNPFPTLDILPPFMRFPFPVLPG